MQQPAEKLKRAGEVTRQHFGKKISFFHPGFIWVDGNRGKYPAVSITGAHCQLHCEHCRAKILQSMISAPNPDLLYEKCLKIAEKGNHGVLISGGSDHNGALPWNLFLPAIEKIKKETNLFVSVHSGIIDEETALSLKLAGVDQALIDIVGDDQTLHDIYHADFGISRIVASLEALEKAGLPIVPHIVCGLNFGKLKGEINAVQIISHFKVAQVVILSIMNLPGTLIKAKDLPDAHGIADIIAEARLSMPKIPISLGCARQRGNRELEKLAIDAGVNRMALPSDEAIEYALNQGFDVRWHDTCCSVPFQ
ncbi:MAG: radical SAM protein [Desulfobacteraceae bacterium]|nr:radical SAM protein [Desulfobacteraceae bacterium]